MERWCQILCSSGAFTRNPHLTDYRSLLHYGPQLQVDGLEALFYASWYPVLDRIAEELHASGLCFPAVHTEKGIGPALGDAEAGERAKGLERLKVNCQFARQIGAGLVVLHLWGMPGSDEHIERNLGMLGDCLNMAQDAGVELVVETIPCVQADPLTHVRRVLEQEARCLIALDTEFLALHQQLDEALAADWLWQGGRVRHVHIKDYDGQMIGPDKYRRYLHPGEGKIDFVGFFSALQKRGFNGSVSLEASVVNRDSSIDLEKLKGSLATLKTLVG